MTEEYMRTDLVEEIYAETLDEFLKIIDPRNLIWKQHQGHFRKWYFRGQRNDVGKEWDLIPTAFRNYKTAKQIINGHDAIKQEVTDLVHFFDSCDWHGIEIPHDSYVLRGSHDLSYLNEIFDFEVSRKPWPFGFWIALSGLAQHYGMPTRLLDWTRLPKHAAYFAAEQIVDLLENSEPVPEFISVWAIHHLASTIRCGGEAFDNEVGRYSNYQLRFLTAPTSNNPHINAQRGLFSVCDAIPWQAQTPDDFPVYSVPDFLIEVLNLQEKDPSNNKVSVHECLKKNLKVIKHIKINSNVALELLDYLENLDGISCASIYPSRYSAVKAIKRGKVIEELINKFS